MRDYPNLTQEQLDMYQDDPEYLDYINMRASKMHDIQGDLFDIECDAVCITTNGFVKKDGSSVMGKGCAKQAADFFPELPKLLGNFNSQFGNNVHRLIDHEGVAILSFPVKPVSQLCKLNKINVVKHMRNTFKEGDTVPGWACIAEPEVILKSLNQLVDMANRNGWKKVLIPRVGCGAGELEWQHVKPVLDRILDGRFYAVTFK